MEKLTVVNTGKRARHRLGHNFEPGIKVEVEVTKSAARALRATRDLIIVTDEPAGDTQAGELDVSQMSVKAVLAAVSAGDLDPNDVYELELQGANRVSLLDALDVEPQDIDETDGDDSPDTSNDGSDD